MTAYELIEILKMYEPDTPVYREYQDTAQPIFEVSLCKKRRSWDIDAEIVQGIIIE